MKRGNSLDPELDGSAGSTARLVGLVRLVKFGSILVGLAYILSQLGFHYLSNLPISFSELASTVTVSLAGAVALWIVGDWTGKAANTARMREASLSEEVAKRKMAEAEARSTVNDLFTLLEAAPIPMFVVDGERRIQRVNASAVTMFELLPSSAQGKRIGDALRCLYSQDDPSGCGFGSSCTACVIRATVVEVLRTDGSTYARACDTPFHMGRKNAFLLSASAVRQSGRPACTVSLLDTAELRRSEAILEGEKEVLETLASGASLSVVLERLALCLEAVVPGVICSVLLLDEDGLHLRHGAAPSLPEEYIRAVDGLAIGPKVGSCGTAAYRKELVVVSDIATDPLWEGYTDLPLKHGLRACWSSPVLSSERRVLGTFAMYYPEIRSPSREELELAARASRIAGIAIERKLAEEAIARSERQYRLLAENATDVIWAMDMELNLTYVSPSVESMLGYTSKDVRALSLEKVLTPESLQLVMHAFKEEMATMRGVERPNPQGRIAEVEVRRKDGSTVWAETRGRLVYSQEGRPFGIVGVLRDVTERRRLTEQLQHSLQKLSLHIEQTPMAAIEWDLDFRVVAWNPKAEQIFGYSKAEAVGRHASVIVPGNAEEQVDSVWRDLINKKGGRRSTNENVTKDGKTILCDWYNTPLVGPEDTVIGVVSLVDDVTEQVKAQEDLRRQRAALEALYAVSRAISGTLDESTILDKGLKATAEALDMDRGAIFLLDPSGQTLSLSCAFGITHRLQEAAKEVALGEGISGQAIADGKPVVLDISQYTTSRFKPAMIEEGIQTVASTPMWVAGSLVGAINIASKSAWKPDSRDLDCFAAIGVQLAVAINNARQHAQVRRALVQNLSQIETFRTALAKLVLETAAEDALYGILGIALQVTHAREVALKLWDSQGQETFLSTKALSASKGVLPIDAMWWDPIRRWTSDRGTVFKWPTAEHSNTQAESPVDRTPVTALVGARVGTTSGKEGILLAASSQGSPFADSAVQLIELMASVVGVLVQNSDLHGQVVRERGSLTAVLANMSSGLLVLNTKNDVVWWNRAMQTLTGIGEDQVVGQPLSVAFEALSSRAEDLGKLHQTYESILNGDISHNLGEITVVQPQRRILSLRAFEIPLRLGETWRGVLVRDVSVERDLERRRETFVSIASHELRMPMTTIIGFAELLLKTEVPESTRREWLQYIYSDTSRLARLVDDLLDVSRIHSGKLTTHTELLSLVDPVTSAANLVRPMSVVHQLVIDIPPSIPKVLADRDKLFQVVTNLLTNAIKYSPKGGQIGVSATHDPDRNRVIVAVKDQGIGIAPEDLTNVFGSFYRVQRPETQAIGGMGMGLYLTMELVGLMGGEIWAESELNKGSVFYVSLPVGAPPGA